MRKQFFLNLTSFNVSMTSWILCMFITFHFSFAVSRVIIAWLWCVACASKNLNEHFGGAWCLAYLSHKVCLYDSFKDFSGPFAPSIDGSWEVRKDRWKKCRQSIYSMLDKNYPLSLALFRRFFCGTLNVIIIVISWSRLGELKRLWVSGVVLVQLANYKETLHLQDVGKCLSEVSFSTTVTSCNCPKKEKKRSYAAPANCWVLG